MTNENILIRPVCIGGPNRAAFLVDTLDVTLQFPVGESYSLSGGTITNVTASVKPTAGVTVGAQVGNNIPIEFTIPDQYWVTITAFDSNGQSYASHRCVFIHLDQPNSPYYPNIDMQRVTARWAIRRCRR